MMRKEKKAIIQIGLFCLLFIGLAGCAANTSETDTAVTEPDAHESEVHEEEHDDHDDAHNGEAHIELPELEAIALQDRPLQVVATTNIIGDVLAQVGGDAIALTTLMQPGQDPHSYEPGAQDLTAVANADVIILNGWDLEETLVHNLENIGENVPMVAISANIEPLSIDESDDDHDHAAVDPHVWLDIHNVEQWVKTTEQIFTELDPANGEIYASNAQAYLAELAELEMYTEEQLATIPKGKRLLVTNHDSLSYFAEAYDFAVVGSVIPSVSSVAEPSASDLATLIGDMEAAGICTIFSETAVSDTLAQTIIAELDDCENVQILQLYTGTLGTSDSDANSYINMFRANVDTIVSGLK